MKLYTKRGDAGLTDLFGGQRVEKDALRVEAYGCVDDLNNVIGWARCACDQQAMAELLVSLQRRLFEIGADLASPRATPQAEEPAGIIPRLHEDAIAEIEGLIDAAVAGVPEMKHFILPGGTELSARLHIARGICRNAERRCVALSKREPVGRAILIYLNRLSDLLFALARQANHLAHVADVPWQSPKR